MRRIQLFIDMTRWMCLAALLLAACSAPAAPAGDDAPGNRPLEAEAGTAGSPATGTPTPTSTIPPYLRNLHTETPTQQVTVTRTPTLDWVGWVPNNLPTQPSATPGWWLPPEPSTSTPTPSRTPTRVATAVPKSPTIVSLTLSPSSLRGGKAVTVTVSLSGPAPKGGAVVALRSSNAVALPVPPSVTVPAGSKSATFTVSTRRPLTNTTVSLTATFNGTKAGAKLTVTP